jgi:hypothetical protein
VFVVVVSQEVTYLIVGGCLEVAELKMVFKILDVFLRGFLVAVVLLSLSKVWSVLWEVS